MIGAVLVGAGTPCTAPAAACGCRLGSSASGTSGVLAAASWAGAGLAVAEPCASAGRALAAVLAGSPPLPEHDARSSQQARPARTGRTRPRGVFKAGLLSQTSERLGVGEGRV